MTTNAQAALAAAVRLGAGSFIEVDEVLSDATLFLAWLDKADRPHLAAVVELENRCQATRSVLRQGNRIAQCELAAGHTGLHVYGKARA